MSKLYQGREARDPSARRVLAASITNLGRSALGYGNSGLAEQLFATALHIRPGNAVALINLGVLYSRAGDLERAAVITERALLRDPNRLLALVNAARYRLALGFLGNLCRKGLSTKSVRSNQEQYTVDFGSRTIRDGGSDRQNTYRLDDRRHPCRIASRQPNRLAVSRRTNRTRARRLLPHRAVRESLEPARDRPSARGSSTPPNA